MIEASRLQERLFRCLWGSAGLPLLLGEGPGAQVGLEETAEAYLVEVDLPGAEDQDVSVELWGRRLVVSPGQGGQALGSFHHEVLLPGEVDPEGASAHLLEGLLTVVVPKAAAERPRRIEVTEVIELR